MGGAYKKVVLSRGQFQSQYLQLKVVAQSSLGVVWDQEPVGWSQRSFATHCRLSALTGPSVDSDSLDRTGVSGYIANTPPLLQREPSLLSPSRLLGRVGRVVQLDKVLKRYDLNPLCFLHCDIKMLKQ